MSWFFGVNRKVPKPPPKVTYRHWLTIKYVGGATDGWHFERDTDHGPLHFWKGFVKWFFAKHTPHFVINVPHKRIVIVRSHILSFNLAVVEVKGETTTRRYP